MTDKNSAAFAKAAFYHPDGGIDSPQEGLSKREYFAAMGMIGFISEGEVAEIKTIAVLSVQMADALIEQLNKQP
jgi:hypothetical protein